MNENGFVEPGLAAGWLLSSFVLASMLVSVAIYYARRRGMLDQPGQRRSHRVPTPRGGGIGVVIAVFICTSGALLTSPKPMSAIVVAGVAAALLLVAVVGWWDDHRPLPVWPRLGAQAAAVVLFSFTLVATNLSWYWVPLLLLAGMWSINLHNFMDGIDGLLAQQIIFVAGALGCLAWSVEEPALAIGAGTVMTAGMGFWFYNRSPARIFMGDVGSGSAGLLVFVFSALLWRVEPSLAWAALVLSSAFVTDASLTLLTRMSGGRSWHRAHREHLYQWMARSGRSHAAVDLRYLGWNLLVAAPAAWWMAAHPAGALPVAAAIYAIAVVLWLALKRRCLQRPSAGGRHVAA
jgi:UDP-N-acetylmuramyl pentapeptide phosphotransferase/UDP-N-acetylglucosamine-1-phosphate transferase